MIEPITMVVRQVDRINTDVLEYLLYVCTVVPSHSIGLGYGTLILKLVLTPDVDIEG